MSPTIWCNLGEASSKLQESQDLNFGQRQRKPHRQGTQYHNVSGGNFEQA